MYRFTKILLPVNVLALLLGSTASFADGWEVNNIWWNLILNWNNSGQDLCIAENFNNYVVNAVFDIYPASFSPSGMPLHGKATPSMIPYYQYRLFGWIVGSKPDPQCTLVSYSVRVKGYRASPRHPKIHLVHKR